MIVRLELVQWGSSYYPWGTIRFYRVSYDKGSGLLVKDMFARRDLTRTERVEHVQNTRS